MFFHAIEYRQSGDGASGFFVGSLLKLALHNPSRLLILCLDQRFSGKLKSISFFIIYCRVTPRSYITIRLILFPCRPTTGFFFVYTGGMFLDFSTLKHPTCMVYLDKRTFYFCRFLAILSRAF